MASTTDQGGTCEKEMKTFEYVVAKYPYEKKQPDELSFQKGDRIKILEKHPSGWWTGEISGADGQVRMGNIPSNFVEAEKEAKKNDAVSVESIKTKVNSAVVPGFTAANTDDDSCAGAFTSTYRDRKLRMILRLAQLVCILISFATAADQSSYADYVEFKAIVAIGVVTFTYILVVIHAYLFNLEAHLPSLGCMTQNPVNFLEFTADTFFASMLFGAMVAGLNKARQMDNTSKARIAGIFAFFTFLLLCATSIISWRLYKEPRKHSNAIELA